MLSLIVILRLRVGKNAGKTTPPDTPAMASGIDTMIESIASLAILIRSAKQQPGHHALFCFNKHIEKLKPPTRQG